MKQLKAKAVSMLKNRKGAFSIEMLIIVGIIVVLVVLAMTAFTRESAEISNQYDSNVSTALDNQSQLNSTILSQKKSFSFN